MKNSPPGSSSRAVLLLYAIIGTFTLTVLYAQVRDFGYVDFDDVFYIRENAVVRAGLSLSGLEWAFTTFYVANWHPLTWVSHMVDVSLFGLDPGAHHLVSVALHGAVSILVFAFGWVYLQRRDAAFLMAMLFMVHPQHVESVAWLAERKDLLCALFFLLALLAYRRYVRDPGALRYGLVMLAFAAALASKPMAVSLPVVLLLLDVWPLRRIASGQPLTPQIVRLVQEKLPLALLSLASCVVTIVAQKSWAAVSGLDDVSAWHRFGNAIVSCVLYLRDFVLPDRLAVFYPFDPRDTFREVLPALGIFFAITGICIGKRRSHPALYFAWLWFLITLLPVIGLVQVGSQARADRYMYIPSIGLFFAIAALLPQPGLPAYRRALLMLAILGSFWASLCYMQVGYWQSPLTLFSRASAVTGGDSFVESRVVDQLIKGGAFEEARKRAQLLVARDPDRIESRMALGSALLATQDLRGAEAQFIATLAIDPGNVPAMNMLGITLYRQERIDEACTHFRRALTIDPDAGFVRANLEGRDCGASLRPGAG